MMTDFRKSFWSTVCIVLVSIVVISSVCWLLFSLLATGTAKSGGQLGKRCAPLIGESKVASFASEQEQVRMATPDYETLVKFVGLIRYNDSGDKGETLLPLRLNNVTLSKGRSSDDKSLVLWTQCARLSLNLASDSKQLIVGSIDVESEFKLADSRRECVIQSTSIRLADVAMRYCCNEPSSYKCEASFWHANDTFVMKTLATLEIYSLEFELEGNSTVIMTNQFSRKQEICGVRAASGGA